MGRCGNDQYTKLLCHFNGPDASTTIVDSSFGGHHANATVTGSAQIDTAQSYFGGSSLLLGANDKIGFADSADWYLATGRFMIDLRIRFADVSADRAIFQQYVDGTHYVESYWDQVSSRLYVRAKDGAGKSLFSSSWSPNVDTWYHIALIRGWGDGNDDWALTVGGTALDTLNDAWEWPDFAAPFEIGAATNAGCFHDGWVDELRISKGTERETANFTPQAFPYR